MALILNANICVTSKRLYITNMKRVNSVVNMPKLILSVALACLIINYCVGVDSNDSILKRAKRYLVYPMGGLFKIVFGIAIPVKLGLKQSLTCSLNFQFQYQAPQNITQLQQFPPTVSRSREKRDKIDSFGDRSLAYRGTEAMLDSYGINGRACLLRSICENALNSLYHRANGIYGHLFHIFLTPDYGDGEYDDDLDDSYIDAQKAGKYGVDCFSLYPDCPYGHGILDRLTILD